MITFFKDKKIENRTKVEPATGQYIGPYRAGLDVNAQSSYILINTVTVNSGSTTSVINSTSHGAIAGDLLFFFGTSPIFQHATVQSVTTNTITLSQTLNAVPTTSSAFYILRPGFSQVTSAGVAITTPSLTSPTYGSMGIIVGTSLTNSYASLYSMPTSAKVLILINSCDQAVVVSIDNGTSDTFILDAYESLTIDYASNGLELPADEIVAKYYSTVPTVGSIRATIAG